MDKVIGSTHYDVLLGDGKGALIPFPLPELFLKRLLCLSPGHPPPASPLHIFKKVSTPRPSPALSYTSAESLDSIITLVENKTAEQIEVDNLIYRLCQSLYKVALKKSSQIHRHASREDFSALEDGLFFNMRGHEDWCPLCHLFDPVSYYSSMKSKSCPSCSCHPAEKGTLTSGTPKDPQKASQWMVCKLSVTRLSGGNSNHVYRLGHASFSGKSILLRVYGRRAFEVIDRVRDVRAMRQMSKAGLCPAVLHSFVWGRVEEFMDSIYTCTTEMLLDSPKLLGIVFEGLYRMHNLDARPFLPENVSESLPGDIPLREVPLADIAAALKTGRDAYYDTLPEIKALEMVCNTSFERASLRLLRLLSPHLSSAALVDWFAGEVYFVRCALLRAEVPIVLSHNDLNPGNILLSRRMVPRRFRGEDDGILSSDDDEVTETLSAESSALSTRYVTRKGRSKNAVERRGHLFIDFEYSDANYRCYDLGNTLCELDYDYTRGTEPGGRGFIKHLFLSPPPRKAAAWAGLGEEYPRLPELIRDAWLRGRENGEKGENGERAENGQKGENGEKGENGKRGESGGEEEEGVGGAALRALRHYFAACDGVALDSVTLSEAQLHEVILGMLASHLHWTLWAAVMGCATDELGECGTDPSAFAKGSSGLDYVLYGECRLREYLALRDWMRERNLI